MSPSYAELHCLSNFSFLRGASHPEELVEQATRLGYSALAITDECSLAGAVRAHMAAKELGLPLIVGTEVRLASPTPSPQPSPPEGEGAQDLRLVLLAVDREGYGNLSQLVTTGRRRSAKGDYHLTVADLDDGLPGCLALLLPPDAADVARAQIDWLRAHFPQRCWIAVELMLDGSDDVRLATLQAMSRDSAVPLVATGDVHMHVRGRRALQDTLTAVRARRPLSQCGDLLFSNGERHLRSRQRLARIYPPELLIESVNVAQCCRFSLDELRYEYPEEIVPPGETPSSWLRKLTEKGFRWRFGAPLEADPTQAATPAVVPAQAGTQCRSRGTTNHECVDHLPDGDPAQAVTPAVVPAQAGTQRPSSGTASHGWGGHFTSGQALDIARARTLVEHELALIAELRYEAYFLTVHDIVRFARDQGILCQGRGSAANSAVCYCLGITEVDPARMEMLFERFISKERNEPPDIDVDFEHERREEVIQYIYGKYGRDRAAITATVIRYRAKSAVRDIGKALGLDLAQVDRLAKNLAWGDVRQVRPERLRECGFDADAPVIRRLLALVHEVIDFPRHLSQHVGGFVIARGSLSRMVPIENAAMEDRSIIQWDKDDIDALGLLKVDVLALGMLSAIRRALALVAERRGRPFTMADVPAEDAGVYEMVSRGDTIGVFQIESRAQQAMLPRMRPQRFYDLVIEVAIVRPGPIQGGMIHPYLRRRAGLEPVTYPSPEVREVLERTLGVPIFQEQVMQLAIVAAGFTPGEADKLRRAMAAWKRRGGLEPFEQRLKDGMRSHGYDEAFAEQIYQQILGFGEYGFPESHSASFALLVYVSSWLKRYEPAAFTCALLNSQPMGFYAPDQLVQDARRHGVEVCAPDVMHSDWDCTLETDAIRLGLRLVKGLSEQGAKRLVEARNMHRASLQSGRWTFEDLALQAGLDRHDTHALAAAGALASLAGHRREAAWTVSAIERRPPVLRHASIAEQKVALAAPSEANELVADYATLGLTLGRHPLALLRARFQRLRMTPAAQLRTLPHGRLTRTVGLVIGRQRPDTASGVIFVTLEDETGMANVIVWRAVSELQRRVLLGARLMAVHGILERQGDVVHLVAGKLVDYTAWLAGMKIRSRDFH